MSGRRIPFYGDKLTYGDKQIKADLASLPEPEAKPSPMESLAAMSEETLQNLMLSKMSIAANIRADIGNLISGLAETVATAQLAELLLAQKQRKKTG